MRPDERNGPIPGGNAATDKPVADPLGRLAREHTMQLELCDALQLIADGLPHRFERKLVAEVINVLAHGLSHHFDFEEDVLFPLLRQRAGGDAALVAALDQLEIEHGRDAELCGELAEELRYFLLREKPRNAEMLGYMLRGFFEGQRRHIGWENSVVLPAARRLLSEEDQRVLSGLIEQEAANTTSAANAPRGGKR